MSQASKDAVPDVGWPRAMTAGTLSRRTDARVAASCRRAERARQRELVVESLLRCPPSATARGSHDGR